MFVMFERWRGLVRNAGPQLHVRAVIEGGIHERARGQSRLRREGQPRAERRLARGRRGSRHHHPRHQARPGKRHRALPGLRARRLSPGRALGHLQVLRHQQRWHGRQQGRHRSGRYVQRKFN